MRLALIVYWSYYIVDVVLLDKKSSVMMAGSALRRLMAEYKRKFCLHLDQVQLKNTYYYDN